MVSFNEWMVEEIAFPHNFLRRKKNDFLNGPLRKWRRKSVRWGNDWRNHRGKCWGNLTSYTISSWQETSFPRLKKVVRKLNFLNPFPRLFPQQRKSTAPVVLKDKYFFKVDYLLHTIADWEPEVKAYDRTQTRWVCIHRSTRLLKLYVGSLVLNYSSSQGDRKHPCAVNPKCQSSPV